MLLTKTKHKCKHKGCKEKTFYMFCFKHKDDIYTDMCKIHGKTRFRNYKCLKCQEMKKPKYTKNKQVLKELDNIFGDRLKHKNRRYQERYISRISSSAGIYGIFTKNGNRCLYVGQSVNVSNRVKQHKECFKKAQRHLIGLKRWNRKLKVYKVEYKYYEMARKYNLSDLKFVRFCTIPKKYLQNPYYNAIITYMEQYMMDVYKPSLNTFSARPNKG